jgi:hypothetical protein
MHTTQNCLPTPPIGTRFTPGLGEVIMEEPRESIPFQDLSKLAKRMDWAVVKMTNVFSMRSSLMHLMYLDSVGFDG